MSGKGEWEYQHWFGVVKFKETVLAESISTEGFGAEGGGTNRPWKAGPPIQGDKEGISGIERLQVWSQETWATSPGLSQLLTCRSHSFFIC